MNTRFFYFFVLFLFTFCFRSLRYQDCSAVRIEGRIQEQACSGLMGGSVALSNVRGYLGAACGIVSGVTYALAASLTVGHSVRHVTDKGN